MRSESRIAFRCEAVCKDFGRDGDRQRILADISLEVPAGQFLTIVGGSGVGKTTLLRMLGGLTPCSSGAIDLRGTRVTEPPEGVVTVFQDYGQSLLPWRTVEQNVALGLEAERVPKQARHGRIREALDKVGLSDSGRKRPWQLSGGMQQRLQIARALAVQPDVLLMDEPFGSLDAITKASLQDELLRLHSDSGATVVFITHDVEEAIYLGDRVVILAGQPATVASGFDVDIPRPRDQIETRASPTFLELRHAVHAAMGHG